MTTDMQRGYSKGYAAGKRRAAREVSQLEINALREEFVQRMILAVAAEVVRSPWGHKVDGVFVPSTGAKAIMGTVRMIADEAADLCNFRLAAQARSEGKATGE